MTKKNKLIREIMLNDISHLQDRVVKLEREIELLNRREGIMNEKDK